MKEKIKNTKGITLVALIITIIVLLIIAVVAITSINNNKIIEYAKNGRDAYTQSKNNETEILSNYENYLNENALSSNDENVNFYKLFVQKLDYAQNDKENGIVFTADNKIYNLQLDYGKTNIENSEYYTYSVKGVNEAKTKLETYNNQFTDENQKVKINEVKYVIYGSSFGIIGKNSNGEVYYAECRDKDDEDDPSKSGVLYYYETNVNISELRLEKVSER